MSMVTPLINPIHNMPIILDPAASSTYTGPDLFSRTPKQKKNTFYPGKPAFTIVIFFHYKPRIAVAILDL